MNSTEALIHIERLKAEVALEANKVLLIAEKHGFDEADVRELLKALQGELKVINKHRVLQLGKLIPRHILLDLNTLMHRNSVIGTNADYKTRSGDKVFEDLAYEQCFFPVPEIKFDTLEDDK